MHRRLLGLRPTAPLAVMLFSVACQGTAIEVAPAGAGFSARMRPAIEVVDSGLDPTPGSIAVHTWCDSPGKSLVRGLWRRAVGEPWAYCVAYFDLSGNIDSARERSALTCLGDSHLKMLSDMGRKGLCSARSRHPCWTVGPPGSSRPRSLQVGYSGADRFLSNSGSSRCGSRRGKGMVAS